MLPIDTIYGRQGFGGFPGAGVVAAVTVGMACSRRPMHPTTTRTCKVTDLGPVELLFVQFPGNQFTGEIAPALADLVESGTIRIIDLVFVAKDADGNSVGFEL